MGKVLCPCYNGMYGKGNIFSTGSTFWSQKGPILMTSLVDFDFAMLFCHCHCLMSGHLYRLLGGRRREK